MNLRQEACCKLIKFDTPRLIVLQDYGLGFSGKIPLLSDDGLDYKKVDLKFFPCFDFQAFGWPPAM